MQTQLALTHESKLVVLHPVHGTVWFELFVQNAGGAELVLPLMQLSLSVMQLATNLSNPKSIQATECQVLHLTPLAEASDVPWRTVWDQPK